MHVLLESNKIKVWMIVSVSVFARLKSTWRIGKIGPWKHRKNLKILKVRRNFTKSTPGDQVKFRYFTQWFRHQQGKRANLKTGCYKKTKHAKYFE